MPLYNYLEEEANNQAEVTKKPKLLQFQFGEGYKQIRKDGINNNLEEISLSFKRTSKDEIEKIYNFLENLAGQPFYFILYPEDKPKYKNPNITDASDLRPLPNIYYCDDYKRTYASKYEHTLTANFKQILG